MYGVTCIATYDVTVRQIEKEIVFASRIRVALVNPECMCDRYIQTDNITYYVLVSGRIIN